MHTYVHMHKHTCTCTCLSPPICSSWKSWQDPSTPSVRPFTEVWMAPPQAFMVLLRSSSTTRPAQNMSLYNKWTQNISLYNKWTQNMSLYNKWTQNMSLYNKWTFTIIIIPYCYYYKRVLILANFSDFVIIAKFCPRYWCKMSTQKNLKSAKITTCL